MSYMYIIICECYYIFALLLCTCSDLRWKLFCENQAEGERLPPTRGVLHQVALRAHYQAHLWHQSTIANPCVPSPEGHGWRQTGGCYMPVSSSDPIAPDTVLNVIRCRCCKSKCQTSRCTCRQHIVACAEMCLCVSEEDSAHDRMTLFTTCLTIYFHFIILSMLFVVTREFTG